MPSNPKKFAIGQLVTVYAKSYLCYEYDSDNRIVETFRYRNPRQGFIVGGVNRQLGKYHKAEHWQSFDGDEFTPAHLEVLGTVFLYQVRFTFHGRIVDVLPENLEPCSND